MNPRLAIRFLTTVLCIGAVVGCQSPQRGGTAGVEAVRISTTRADLFGIPAEYRALHVSLEKLFDKPVAFAPQPDGKAIGQQLNASLVQYAILSADDYAKIEDTQNLKLLASAVNELGKTTRLAHIVTKAKSHVKSVGDIAGKRFAFGKYHDLLTDYAARRALEANNVPLKKLLPELVPTTVALPIDGRLYCGEGVPKIVVWDLTINAGVIDEVAFNDMPDSGGNPITGPSKDQFQILGETQPVPEMVIVAGPAADPAQVERFKDFLIHQVKDQAEICKQLKVKGFAEPDVAAYAAARELLKKKS